jgi:hypothetical protein
MSDNKVVTQAEYLPSSLLEAVLSGGVRYTNHCYVPVL